MISRTTLLVVEEDCSALVPLMLWLDQFPEFEIVGRTNDSDLLSQIQELEPDVVLLGIESPGPEDLHLHLRIIRNIRALNGSPAVLFTCQTVAGAYDTILANESDGFITYHDSLKEIFDSVRKAANKRKLAQSTANMPMTKAG